MGRLLLFLFGVLVGAAGIYVAFEYRMLAPPAGLPVQGVAAANAPAPALEPPREPLGQVLAPTTTVMAPDDTSAALPAAPATTMPASSSTSASAVAATLATPSTAVNASEQPTPVTPEARAAVTAATTTAADGRLLLPVQGVQPAQLVDTFTQARGSGRVHDAIDIMAARGTPVLAVADGRVAKLFNSKLGGLTVYQFDREEKLAYYYAHLDAYAPGIAEGKVLKRGELVGMVGSTGNASATAPHLHFAVFVLGPEKRWWQGTAVNPYPLLGGR